MTDESQKAFEREVARDIHNVKTDVEVMKRDVQNLHYLYERLESTLIRLDSTTNKLDNIMSIQERTLGNIEKMLADQEEDHTEQFRVIRAEMDSKFKERVDVTTKMETRIGALERFRWIAAGVLGAAMFAAPYLKDLLFG
jgi:predicted  nucleic acid-binding Zn-ribbon protein